MIAVQELTAQRRGGLRRFRVMVEVEVTVGSRGGERLWDIRPEVICSCGADLCPHKLEVLARLADERDPAA